jgi:hypothetical protein
MDQRRIQRFQLQLPVSVTCSDARLPSDGFTKNISSSGILFTMGNTPPLGGSIEYIVVLHNEPPQFISLRCMGRVLRVDRIGTGQDEDYPTYQIAATLERYKFVRSHAT